MPAERMQFKPGLQLSLSPRVLLTFALAVIVGAAVHELAHHFVAALECGGFGRLTLTRFQQREGCDAVAGHIAGPAASFLFLWGGAGLLRRRSQLLGFAAVVAGMPVLRLVSVLSGGDDLNVVMHTLTGQRHERAVQILVVTLLVPPLVLAYRSLTNRRRWLVFPLALLVPLFPAAVLQPLDLRVFSPWIDAPETFRQPTLIGIPLAVLGFNLLSAVVLWRWGLPVLLGPAPDLARRYRNRGEPIQVSCRVEPQQDTGPNH